MWEGRQQFRARRRFHVNYIKLTFAVPIWLYFALLAFPLKLCSMHCKRKPCVLKIQRFGSDSDSGSVTFSLRFKRQFCIARSGLAYAAFRSVRNGRANGTEAYRRSGTEDFRRNHNAVAPYSAWPAARMRRHISYANSLCRFTYVRTHVRTLVQRGRPTLKV